MAGRSELSNNWRAKSDTPSEIVSHSHRLNEFRSSNTTPTALGQRDLRKPISRIPSIDHIRGEEDPRTLQAIEEGRRVYVGNLPYMAKTEDVENLFVMSGYQIEHINMSIDPYSGRNPSYCFVELTSKAQADQAKQELNGQQLLGRPVKLGPGVAKSKKKPSADQKKYQKYPEREVFRRWTRADAEDHFEGYSEQGRRLWVGGLPKMGEHAAINKGIRELFDGFEIEAVSKVVIPATPAMGDPKAWNHRYLFVDFPSADEARRAAKATDGRHAWGVQIRVQPAKVLDSHKARERVDWHEEDFESQLP